MARRRTYVPLRVLLNNRLVGLLTRQTGGEPAFRYDATWLEHEHALPVSLSLPLREEAWRGAAVAAAFENLLPDADELRERVAQRVGARGSDTHQLLTAIGRDCVGALQFVPEGEPTDVDTTAIVGAPVSRDKIAEMLANLPRAPLGLRREDAFRISLAGAQEKTALLRHDGRWLKPHGATPTTHIFKPQIGRLPNGIDMSDSVENEFLCLKLARAFGLRTNAAEMRHFAGVTALVIERFDRRWSEDGRLLRLPQEDCCQALGIPPARKYQAHGGPSMAAILTLLKGSDTPAQDQKRLLQAQLLFCLLGATDGHGKNFGVFLRPGGGFSLTPLYDVLSAQPAYAAGRIRRREMGLAMSVGKRNRYRLDQIFGRHFLQTGQKVGLAPSFVKAAMDELLDQFEAALTRLERSLPKNFPEQLLESVTSGMRDRLPRLRHTS